MVRGDERRDSKMKEPTLGDRLFERVRLAIIRRRFHQAIQGIYATSPLIQGSDPFVVLSMVQHKDIAAYLVAIKSFALHLRPEKIVIICDKSITPDDEALLNQHIPHAVLHKIAVFLHPRLPNGGTCWERLHALTTYAAKEYVVQLDADTVTLGALPEVEAAIKNRQGFVLNGYLPGDDDDEPATEIVPIEQASRYAHRWSPLHVQALAEQQLNLAGLSGSHYVRGCAGFTGFPPDPALCEKLVEFSTKMEQLLGSRWREWGTEQVASNYLVANAADAQLLPQPKYSAPGNTLDGHDFLHFIGPCRFVNRNYEIAVKRAIGLITHSPVSAE